MSFSVPIFEPPRESNPRSLTLAEILDIIVRREIESYNQRHQEHRLLEWLSDEDLLAGIGAGKVAFGNREGNQAEFDSCFQAVADAIKDGLVLVFVDKLARNKLNERIECRWNSRAMFVRIRTLRG